MVDDRSTYHGVLGELALNELWIITLNHHLCMKFPTEQGIAIIWDNQMGSRECYLNPLL